MKKTHDVQKLTDCRMHQKLSCIGAHINISQDCFKFGKSIHDARAILGMERNSTFVTPLEYDSIQKLYIVLNHKVITRSIAANIFSIKLCDNNSNRDY